VERETVSGDAPAANHASMVELQELLFGDTMRQVEALRARLDDAEVRAFEESRTIAQSMALSAKRDPKLKRVLAPLVEESLRLSVDQNPGLLAGALFPIVGEAVRKAVAHALQQMFDSMNYILAQSFSVRRWGWRLEAMRTGKTFAEVALARSLAYRVEHVYIIHRRTGLLLAEVSNHSDLMQDADMIVGMLTAIQDFVRDSFTAKKQDDLDEIQIGDFKIWQQHGPVALLAAVVRGQPPATLRQLFIAQVDRIHKNYSGAMVRFEATGQPIPGIEAGLDECLVEEANAGRQSYLKFKIAGVVLLAAIAAGLFVHVRYILRWNAYIGALEREPGIVVIEEYRHRSHLVVRGLRDPLAADPVPLLAKYHLSPRRVAEVWEPYYSLDPRFADVRRLNDEIAVLSKEAVRFEVDSTKLPIDQLALVDTVGDQIQELVKEAAAQGKEMHIQLFGHTDKTGTEEHNATLSQQRAEAIVRLLVSHGIDPDLLSAAGLGDKQAGHATDEPEQQDLDRRVTFVVTLETKAG
jgi:outer membrane protein OmpA-like peptidoglycan-associated protein